MSTNWERQLLRSERGRAAQRRVLAPFEFMGDGVFVTKQGHVGVILAAVPVASECLEPLQSEQVCRQFDVALRNLDPAMRVGQFVMKRGSPVVPHREYANEILNLATAERLDYLQSQGDSLYSFDFYLSVVYEPRRIGKPFRPFTGAAQIDSELNLAANHLRSCVNAFVEGLDVIKARLLPKAEAFAFFRKLMNYDRFLADAAELREDHNLDFWMSDESLSCDGALRVGRHHCRVFTLKAPPSMTSANCLRELLRVPCPAMIISEWKPVAGEKFSRDARAKERYLETSKQRASLKGGEGFTDHGKVEMLDQLHNSQRKAVRDGTYAGDYSLTVILYNEDANVLRTAAGRASNALQQLKGALVEQMNFGALAAWLGTVPGNFDMFRFRKKRINNRNYSHLAFLFGGHTGNLRNEYFNDECLAVLENSFHQPYSLNLHKGEVGHTICTGRSGAGKSYLANFVATWFQKYSPKTIILDVKGGFRYVTERFNGAYVQLGQKDGATINPFALPLTDDNVNFLHSFIRRLIESDGSGKLTGAALNELEESIRNAYAIPVRLRRLGSLSLPAAVRTRLTRWIHDPKTGRSGQFAHLFDNERDTLSESEFTCYNFPENDTDAPEALEALVYYTLHRTSQSVDADPARPKLLIIDEAWSFLKDPELLAYLTGALKTWRHRNAACYLSTHSVEDLPAAIRSEILRQCVTRIHGQNDGLDFETWTREFKLGPAEARLITELHLGQFLVQGHGVVNLRVPQNWHWLYSNSPVSDAQRSKVFAEHDAATAETILSNGAIA